MTSGEPTALERMLEARSIAIVGASVRRGSVGNQAVRELVEAQRRTEHLQDPSSSGALRFRIVRPAG